MDLGSAWWVFADNRNKERFRERQREGKGIHLGIRYSLQIDLIARLEDRQLQAYGIEEGSDAGPIHIAEYYFSKTAEVDYDNDTVSALGKKFYEVRVQGDREPPDETQPSEPEPAPYINDLREIAAQRARERLLETPPSVPKTSREPRESTDQGEREPLHETLPSERSPSKARGRPSKTPDIDRAIDILVKKGVDLAKMPRPSAYRAVKECAASELYSDTQLGFSDPVIQRSLFRRFGRRF